MTQAINLRRLTSDDVPNMDSMLRMCGTSFEVSLRTLIAWVISSVLCRLTFRVRPTRAGTVKIYPSFSLRQ